MFYDVRTVLTTGEVSNGILKLWKSQVRSALSHRGLSPDAVLAIRVFIDLLGHLFAHDPEVENVEAVSPF